MIIVQLATTAFNVGRLTLGMPATLLAIGARLSGVATIFAAAARVVAEHEGAIRREVEAQLCAGVPVYTNAFEREFGSINHLSKRAAKVAGHEAGIDAVREVSSNYVAHTDLVS